MSFHLDYRPADFDEVFGNKDTLESIQQILTKDTHPHSYLLTGQSGCGKTTVARIMAHHLDCTDIDYQELNGADVRGIDGVREIIKQSRLRPLKGKAKLYMIDECHKLTNDAQNALLKILEDTPKHVYFILATTEPDKLLKTIKSRCSVFQMQVLSDREMLRLLRKIVKSEETKIEKQIYEQIIMDSQGHPRQALTILEQVLSVPPEKQLEMAKRKSVEVNEGIELSRALLKNANWGTINKILKGLKGNDPESIRRAVAGYASAVLLNTDNELAGLILEYFTEPFYKTGWPDLVLACYSITKG